MGQQMNVTVVASGGFPVTQVTANAPSARVLTAGGAPITLTTGATPFALFYPDGSPYEGEVEAPAYVTGSISYDTELQQGSAMTPLDLDDCFTGTGNAYSVIQGALPAGVTLSSGVISGTPTGFQGREWITIQASNASGTAARQFLMSVRPSTSAGAFGAAYTTTYENTTLGASTLDGASNVLVRNVTFTGQLQFRSCTNVLVIDCTIDHTAETDGLRISNTGTGCDQIVFYNNTIQNNNKDGINISGDAPLNSDIFVLNNTIDNVGNSVGLEHGMYVWCYATIVGNVITNSGDGNGISLRSSARVANNFIDGAYESGISYFADHPADTPATLLIEGNTLVGCGTNGSDTDVRLRNDPSAGANLVSEIVIRNNFFTMDDRSEVIVGTGYSGVTLTGEEGVGVEGNVKISDAVARAKFP